MNKKIKYILNITLIAISLSILSGCTYETNEIFNFFVVEDIKFIEFTADKLKKNVDRQEDIKLIQKIFSKIDSEVVLEDLEVHGWKYEFKIMNENKELVNKIIIYSDYLESNNKLYKYDSKDNLYIELNELYNKLEYDEVVEENIEISIKEDRIRRDTLEIREAIQGVWFKENNEHLYFTPEHLVQGTYKFKYKINEVGSNYIYITALQESKLSTAEKALFDLHIEIDNTKNNIKLTKTVNQLWTSPLVYEENAIYINDDNYMLGSFDSDFFK